MFCLLDREITKFVSLKVSYATLHNSKESNLDLKLWANHNVQEKRSKLNSKHCMSPSQFEVWYLPTIPESGHLRKNRGLFLSVIQAGKSKAVGPIACENILVPTNVRIQEARRFVCVQTFENETAREQQKAELSFVGKTHLSGICLFMRKWSPIIY